MLFISVIDESKSECTVNGLTHFVVVSRKNFCLKYYHVFYATKFTTVTNISPRWDRCAGFKSQTYSIPVRCLPDADKLCFTRCARPRLCLSVPWAPSLLLRMAPSGALHLLLDHSTSFVCSTGFVSVPDKLWVTKQHHHPGHEVMQTFFSFLLKEPPIL